MAEPGAPLAPGSGDAGPYADDGARWRTFVVGPDYGDRVARVSLRLAAPVWVVLLIAVVTMVVVVADGSIAAMVGGLVVVAVSGLAVIGLVRGSTRKHVARALPPGTSLHLRILPDQLQTHSALGSAQQPWAAFRGVRVLGGIVLLRPVSGAQQAWPVELFGPEGVAYVAAQVAAVSASPR